MKNFVISMGFAFKNLPQKMATASEEPCVCTGMLNQENRR
jgi:hypothetical protein